MKKFYFLGLAMLFGAIGVGHAQVQISTFEKLQEVGKVFSDARNASSSLAAKNTELDEAKKAVEAAKDELTTAKNELTAAKSELSSANTALNSAKSTLESLVSDTISYRRRYDTAKEEYEEARTDSTNLENELDDLKKNGSQVNKKFGLNEKDIIASFCDAAYDENLSEKTLYYKVDPMTLSLLLSTTPVEGYQEVSSLKSSTKSYTALWKAGAIKAIFNKAYEDEDPDDIPEPKLTSIRFLYTIEWGGDKEPTTETARMTISASGNATTLLSALNNAINDFAGIEKLVIAVDPDAVRTKEDEIAAQKKEIAKLRTAFYNAKADLNDKKKLVTSAQQTVDTAQTAYNTANTAVETAEGAVTTATTKLNKANDAVTRIENEITAINANVNRANEYKSLSITANITIPETYKINETDEDTDEETNEANTYYGKDFTLGDWGSDYTIAGNGNVITYPAGANGALTSINRGLISNLGVVNGKIATTNGGNINIAFETTDQNTYEIYDAAGGHTSSPISGELGYRVRQYFGVTISSTGALGTLAKKTADNIVYKAEWTNANTKATTTFYANVTGGNLSYNPAAAKKNTFVYVQDTDIDAAKFTVGKNIVVNGECQRAEFVDDAVEGDDGWVYIPTKFTAKNLTYERKFSNTALATACLPFEVPASNFEKMGLDKIMQFSNVDTQTGTYWFQYQDGSMKANEPYVLKFKDNGANIPNGGKIFESLQNIEVAATGNIDRFEVAPSRPGTGAEFLGVFVSTNASMLARGDYKLYGFGNGVFRPMTISAENKCKAFRTYVKTPNTGNAPATNLVIGELDELGNVVSSGGTTGVNAAVADADAFSVKGGNGVVIITTGKAQKVSVYTVGGSLVKAANVEAGTVSVPVAAGVYIVNGKKVVVK